MKSLAEDAFSDAVRRVSTVIALDDVEVTFILDPDAVIPEWGVGGYTEDANRVTVALDPSAELRIHEISSTLVHEFHHAMRWRHTTLDKNLRDMLASEGLAVMFETDLMGVEPFYAQHELPAVEVELALQELDVEPCDTSRWFYGGGTAPPAFGYTYGYRLCRAYGRATNKEASELIDVPAHEIIDFESGTL
jgi:uncharacterized protein YjaZ